MPVDYKDYYKILGVSKDADTKAIRQAFRKLARQYHPDVNPGDKAAEEHFKEVNEANEVLSDPEKRKKYDEMSNYYQQYGQWPGAVNTGGSYAGATNFAGFGTGGNYHYQTVNEEDLADLFGGEAPFSDFFETYFHSTGSGPHAGRRRTSTGGRSQRTRTQSYDIPGQDVASTVEISLAEAYQGVTRTFELSEADGSTRRLEVKIPAGVDEGSRIRIAGQGLQGTSRRGDLFLQIHIDLDARFTRDDSTLRTTVDVPLADAMLGGEAAVLTPDSRRLMLRIPPETTNGKSFRLRGQGMPLQTGQTDKRGDLYATVSVVLPTGLTREQRELFEAFARSIGYSEKK
jgi:DnaJ-class molecular chaperone